MLAITAAALPAVFNAQVAPADSLAPVEVKGPVIIESTRAESNTPVTFTNLTQKDLKSLNTGQDVPYVLRFTPSLVATSDAGTGIGYTGLWIRGSDPSRINVTINGVPLNDPESQQVFWVNLPDFVSSANSIQIQRGVGTSTNGASAFGGTIKLETTKSEVNPYAEISTTAGSFNTLRNSVRFGTGLMGNRFIVEGRLSSIQSDGYIDRATADLKSAYIAGTWLGKKTVVRLTGFSGRERTYQAWYGTPASRLSGNRDSMLTFASNNFLSESETANLLNSGRTYNFYTYPNQIDNYGQDHAQLHVSHQFSQRFTANGALHYTHGRGYFEEFRGGSSYSRYGLPDVVIDQDTITETDLVRRRWLDNDFFGGVFSLRYKGDRTEWILGGAWNEYTGRHFGELTWMQFSGNTPKDARYYEGRSTKQDGNIYLRATRTIRERWTAYADLQVRDVRYITSGVDNDLKRYDVNDHLTFFNPKAGVSYARSKFERFYISAAVGQKEPNRNDYIDAPEGRTPKAEQMLDIEAGWQYYGFGINYYDMMYRNQLILTGAVNDVGAPVRTNVESSFRRGIEAEFNKEWNGWLFNVNATRSWNRIKEFTEVIPDYLNGGEQTVVHTNTHISFSPDWIGGGRIGYDFFHSLLKPLQKAEREQHLRVIWMSRYVSEQYLDNTGNAGRVIDAYFVNDVRAEYEVNLGSMHLFTAITVNNALNSLYASNGYTYSYLFGGLYNERFFYPQATRNALVQITLKF